jgi:glucose/arabinose dehydrogenase
MKLPPLFLLHLLGGVVGGVGTGWFCFGLFHVSGESLSNPADRIKAAKQCQVISIADEAIFAGDPVLIARTEEPVDLTFDELGNTFVLERSGRILRIAAGEADEASDYAWLEKGAVEHSLGYTAVAWHPDFYRKNRPGYGRFYIVVAEETGSGTPDFLPEYGAGRESHQDVLYEYRVEQALMPHFKGNRRELMRFQQPGQEHNVGGLCFDPAGHLYIAVGDGAEGDVGGDSPSRNASKFTNAYGKILRIDPTGDNSANGAYGIPATNPYRAVADALPELWAYGLRTPHQLSYDSLLRELYVCESEPGGIEQIEVSSHGGEHFGWDLNAQAAHLGIAAQSRLSGLCTPAVISLDRTSGAMGATVGSMVYRGETFPTLAGKLIFADHEGRILAFGEPGITGAEASRLDLPLLKNRKFVGLREGPGGEVVLLCEDGDILGLRKPDSVGSGNKSQKPVYCAVP